jgi:hypothetical protein
VVSNCVRCCICSIKQKRLVNNVSFPFVSFRPVSFRFVSQSFPLLPTCSQQVSRLFIFMWSHSDTRHSR